MQHAAHQSAWQNFSCHGGHQNGKFNRDWLRYGQVICMRKFQCMHHFGVSRASPIQTGRLCAECVHGPRRSSSRSRTPDQAPQAAPEAACHPSCIYRESLALRHTALPPEADQYLTYSCFTHSCASVHSRTERLCKNYWNQIQQDCTGRRRQQNTTQPDIPQYGRYCSMLVSNEVDGGSLDDSLVRGAVLKPDGVPNLVPHFAPDFLCHPGCHAHGSHAPGLRAPDLAGLAVAGLVQVLRYLRHSTSTSACHLPVLGCKCHPCCAHAILQRQLLAWSLTACRTIVASRQDASLVMHPSIHSGSALRQGCGTTPPGLSCRSRSPQR